MVKRKAKELENGTLIKPPRRSSRRTNTVKQDDVPDLPVSAKKSRKTKVKDLIEERKEDEQSESDGSGGPSDVAKEYEPKPKKVTKSPKPSPKASKPETTSSRGRQYWLMKAEPESRLEKGRDVKFSIDDLAAKKEPEPWDGIRAYPARNNLRAMKKGDLAFFYHSSCKVPAIVGIMEIAEEHSPDLTAHDPSAPYHDPNSTPDNPKWSVVHVSFRQKLVTPITLKELREFQGLVGSPLKEMQMLKLTRLSVSRVSEVEWGFLVGVLEERGEVVEGLRS